MYKCLYEFLEKNSVNTNTNLDSEKNHSTTKAVMEVIDNISIVTTVTLPWEYTKTYKKPLILLIIQFYFF